MTELPTIFIDSDGVVAHFDKRVFDLFGVERFDNDDDLWDNVMQHPTFFRDLEVMPGALEFLQLVKPYRHYILTACPKRDYERAARNKVLFFREKVSEDIRILPMLGGKNKALFIHKPGDVLIDDYRPNVAAWTAAGGFGILHKNFADTTEQLMAYLRSFSE